MENKKYFVGFDIGTDSVGYAVTDRKYKLLKHKDEPMWGVTTFEEANQAQDRREFRTARRRLNRRQARVNLLSELFAKEIAKTDKRFFVRLSESYLYRDDVSNAGDRHIFFNDGEYKDKDYFKAYPTIHHLISELMESKDSHDVRLVYLALAWLVAHRGHFLSEISIENVEQVKDFSIPYKKFERFFTDNSYELPWSADSYTICDIINMSGGVTAKETKFKKDVFDGKIPDDKDEDTETVPFNRKLMMKFLCGGTVSPKDFFKISGDAYTEVKSFSASTTDEDLEEIYSELGDDAEIIRSLKELYDTALLIKLLGGYSFISEAKREEYEHHRADLKTLKDIIRKYLPKNKYSEMFRVVLNKKDNANYLEYSGNVKSVKNKESLKNYKSIGTKEAFYKYVSGTLKGISPVGKDKEVLEDIFARISDGTYMPKQVNPDNRVIPYQLYYVELKAILNNAEEYLPFLKEKDANGLSVSDKIISIFTFRVPYYVGPLHKENNHAWIERKSKGRIYPWNFDEKVDLDKSEDHFIKNLINTCSYVPGEQVLPKCSLLYSKFCVLNEINNIKINSVEIPVEIKQKIFTEVFMKYSKVTAKIIRNWLESNGCMKKDDTLSGVDVNLTSSLRPYRDFARFLSDGALTESEVEDIISRITYTDDKGRLKKWLSENYPKLSKDDRTQIASRSYKDFGRLSKKLLTDILGCEKKGNGEASSIIEMMWNTNLNLMQLLSDKYTFAETLESISREYYSDHPMTLSDRLDEMYVSNAVKRPIIRTVEILSDIVKANGCAPEKIFIEMARGATDEQKGKRTKSRKTQLEEYYDTIKDRDICELRKELEALGEDAEGKLQSEKYYLYFLQLGRCMYSGEPIVLSSLANDKLYDIDHIWPQSAVKDDSVINNKVLVLSTLNAQKKDVYPIPSEFRSNMSGYWKYLYDMKLISEEKYKRLTRSHAFTPDERLGFINRQMVETRQSTKAVATILKEKLPETEIVYVKAGLVSDFRHEYGILKSRTVNDLHHGKDAYLNVVVGDVYHEKFTKNFYLDRPYSLNTHAIYKCKLDESGNLVGEGKELIEFVCKTARKNHMHITRYAFCRKGGLFDQMPVKASSGLTELKSGLPTERYGGYNKPTASFFVLVRFRIGKKQDAMIMPVELMYADRFRSDKSFAAEYAKKTVSSIKGGKTVEDLSFPLGDRVLRVNTVLEFDGMRMCLSGKASGGVKLLVTNMMPLVCDADTEEYIRKIEKILEKQKENPSLRIDYERRGITVYDNCCLYDFFVEKFSMWPFADRPANPINVLVSGKESFVSLTIDEQVRVLSNILTLLTRYGGGADLTSLGGVKGAGATTMSSSISNWNYSNVCIIDQSPSGIYETKSDNLLDLL